MKTLTFTFEDALLSPESLAMLSGAGILEGTGALNDENAKKVYVHMTYDLVTEKIGDKIVAKLSADERDNAVLVVTKEAPVYAWTLNGSGRQEKPLPAIVEDKITVEGTAPGENLPVNANRGEIDAFGRTIVFELDPATVGSGQTVRIDCYAVHTDGARELIISADKFAGYYYIEAETLMRDEETGVDVPVEFIIPRAKIQSNFTLSMAATGDPSELSEMRMAA